MWALALTLTLVLSLAAAVVAVRSARRWWACPVQFCCLRCRCCLLGRRWCRRLRALRSCTGLSTDERGLRAGVPGRVPVASAGTGPRALYTSRRIIAEVHAVVGLRAAVVTEVTEE